MDTNPLSSAEKKELRGIAQRLKPHIHIGKQGVSESVLAEIETALIKNGLIKIRFESNKNEVKLLCDTITEKAQCEFVGGIGRVGIFFRDMPDKSAKV